MSPARGRTPSSSSSSMKRAPDALVEEAIAHLRQRRLEPAIELLVECWRLSRIEPLADAVEQVSQELLYGATPIERGEDGAWIALADKRRACDLGLLLLSLFDGPVTLKLDAMTRWPPDPRLGSVVAAAVADRRIVDKRDLRLAKKIVERCWDERIARSFPKIAPSKGPPADTAALDGVAVAPRRDRPQRRPPRAACRALPAGLRRSRQRRRARHRRRPSARGGGPAR
jgi:hypothetical protein